jgi:hypothetical protein
MVRERGWKWKCEDRRWEKERRTATRDLGVFLTSAPTWRFARRQVLCTLLESVPRRRGLALQKRARSDRGRGHHVLVQERERESMTCTLGADHKKPREQSTQSGLKTDGAIRRAKGALDTDGSFRFPCHCDDCMARSKKNAHHAHTHAQCTQIHRHAQTHVGHACMKQAEGREHGTVVKTHSNPHPQRFTPTPTPPRHTNHACMRDTDAWEP